MGDMGTDAKAYPPERSERNHPRLRPLEFIPVSQQGRAMVALRDPLGVSEQVLLVPRELASILGLLDGSYSMRDLQAEVSRRLGRLVFREELEGFLQTLDDAGFLETETFRGRLAALQEEFRRSSVRPAFHAGKSYPGEARELADWLASLAVSAGRDEPVARASGAPSALVAPHIDLRLGGAAYVRAYECLDSGAAVDTFVVLGIGHQGLLENFSIAGKDFLTPLGRSPLDRELYDEVRAALGSRRFREDLTHRSEHSIEFQVLWLQHRFRSRPKRILPILCSFSPQEYQDRAEVRRDVADLVAAVQEAAGRLARRVSWIAGVDLSHVGPRYGDPFRPSEAQVRQVLDWERELLDCLVEKNVERFARLIVASGDRTRICGFPALVTLLHARPEGYGEVLDHRYAFMDENRSFVTFAAVAYGGRGESGEAEIEAARDSASRSRG
ncbi:MAG: AmmeMemoRadiSam system protein B [Acidobacteriota bacterium]